MTACLNLPETTERGRFRCNTASDCLDGFDCGGGYCVAEGSAKPCIANCEEAEKNCGAVDDGCGGTLQCGTCQAPQICGGGGIANVCGSPPCTATTCEAVGANCGSIDDGCGLALNCGSCNAPATCGGGGTENVCGQPGCTPTSCVEQGANCDIIDDGCGGTLNCGTCNAPTTCGGGGTANVCGQAGCMPTSCSVADIECGAIGDGCGGIVQCGTCTPPQTCGGGGTPNVCGSPPCTPTTCQAEGAQCGTIDDGCGATLSCGTCTAPDTCAGGGSPNLCGCTPKTCLEVNAECGQIDDGCGGTEACGNCSLPETCGGGGTANLCGCTPTTCAAEGADCGTMADGCGGSLSCGTCTSPQVCGGGGGSNVCGDTPCTPTTCTAQGAACGTVSDGCGSTLDCGTCTPPDTCAGGGTANTCGCTPDCTGRCAGDDGCGGTCPDDCTAPETCGGGGTAEVCGCTSNCVGKCAGDDGCGGTCPNDCTAPETCGGGGTAEVCGCTPATCTSLAVNCGNPDDGCGSTLSCGSCTLPETCGAVTPNVCGCIPNCIGKCAGPDGCDDTCPDNCTAPQSCGGGGIPEVCGGTAPRVVSATPANGATDVAVGMAITIGFDEEMDTVKTEAAFAIVPAASGTHSWNAENTLLTFAPASPLAFNASYSVTLGSGATDLDDNPIINAPYSFSFTTETLPPAPLYPVNGANWNDYVKNDGATVFSASDTPCAGTETLYYSACLHGAVMRSVDSGDTTQCLGLTAYDSLGAFKWVCDDTGGTAVWRSLGFQDGKRMADLIDFGALTWKDNQLIVNGGANFTTPMGKWWTNPIVEYSTGTTLSTPGTVYAARANLAYPATFTADRVALVVRDFNALSGTGVGNTVVSATGRKFIWFEGEIDGTNDGPGIGWNDVTFSVARSVKISNVSASGVVGYPAGFYMTASSKNFLQDVRVSGTASASGAGLWLASGSSYNTLRQIRSGANDGKGLHLKDSSYNRFSDIVCSGSKSAYGIELVTTSSHNIFNRVACTNNGSVGILTASGSGNNTFVDVTACNNGGIGVQSGGDNNVFFNVTAVNNGLQGLMLGSGVHKAIAFNVVSANSGSDGIFIVWSDENTLINIAVGEQDAAYADLALSSTENNLFTGHLKLRDGQCDISSSTNPGLTGSCYSVSPSDAITYFGVDLASAFVGKVLFDDPVNPADIAGSGDYNLPIDNWVDFDNRYRGWGRDYMNFPSPENRGECDENMPDCRIWDWSLVNKPPQNKNICRSNEIPTGNDTLVPPWGGMPYLRNAVELFDDGKGDDDGFCEADEDCLYTPNIGAYQGHTTAGASLQSLGPIAPGVLSGITLYQHEFNGY